MKINPAYAVNNFLNNEITGIARGVYNIMSPEDIIGYWDKVGVMHPRLMQGYGMGGLGLGKLEAAGEANKAFQTLLNAYDESAGLFAEAKQFSAGWVGRLGQKIKSINTPFDASTFAQKIERSASMRFMTKGMIEGMAQLAGLLLEESLRCKHEDNAKAIMTVLERTKFREPVRPGDTLVYRAEVMSLNKNGNSRSSGVPA